MVNEYENITTASDKTEMQSGQSNITENNIAHIRDISVYLDTLIKSREHCLLILCVKDTPGENVPGSVMEKVHELGFSNLTNDRWRTYIGIIDQGETVYDHSNERVSAPLKFSTILRAGDVDIVSQTWKYASSIKINGIDNSLDCRGWNIVVF